MSEITRRDALGRLAAAFAGAVAIDAAAARSAHAAVQQAAGGGAYAPKALSPDQFRTLSGLADLIIPADNGKPGAILAGVPAWIDMLLNVNEELKATCVTGLTWIDS